MIVLLAVVVIDDDTVDVWVDEGDVTSQSQNVALVRRSITAFSASAKSSA